MPTQATDTNMREMKGLAIAAKGAQIKRINKLSYGVRSQSNGQWYSVVEHYGKSIEGTKAYWTCTCPDNIYRKSQCKHICAVLYSKELRKQIVEKTTTSQDVAEIITEVSTSVNEIVCPQCKGSEIVKHGIRHTKHGTDIQRYSCKDCHFRFAVNSGFERARADGKVVTAALDLYFKVSHFVKYVTT
jgi:putative transposase